MSGEAPFKATPPEVGDLSLLALEVWRLEKKLAKVSVTLGIDDSKSINNSVEKIKAFLDKNNIETVDFTGQKYSDGLNIDVLSFLDEKRGSAIISETIEPTVKYDGKFIKRAKVIVTK